MANTVLHGTVKILGPLPDGTGNKILTIDPASGEVGMIDSLISGVSGDITIDGSGVASITAGVIVDADINASAAIAWSKMAALTASSVMVTDASGVATTSIATTVFNHIANLSSDAQAQINTKQDTIVGAASTVVTDDLAASKAVVSDADGKIAAHADTTATEIGYVHGATSSLQDQLDVRLIVNVSSPSSGQVIAYDGSEWVNTTPSAGNLPSGGIANQFLQKVDGTDYNATWVTIDLTDVGVSASAAEVDSLINISGNVQAQLNDKQSTVLTTDRLLVGVGNVATETTNLPTGTTIGSAVIYRVGGSDVTLADGGTGASLADPGADRIFFWDDSESASTWLEVGSGLLLSGTTLTATAVGLTDGDKGDITVSSTGTVWTIDNSAVTYAKIQDVSATSRILGRITTGAGVIEELTGTQATTLLDTFTDVLQGVVPASGGGTTNFLRADGTWAAVSSGTPPGSDTQMIFNDGGSFGTDLGFTYDKTTDTLTVVNLDTATTVGSAYIYRVGGIDVAVTDGGTGLSAISALSILVANTANTFAEVTPGAGNSIRVNAGGTAWEAFTPSSITVPGSDTQVIFNDSGVLGADDGLVYDKTLDSLTIKNFRILELNGSSYFLGFNAGNTSATGTSDVAIGNGALLSVTSGSSNIAIGSSALNEVTTGTGNIWIGQDTTNGITTGDDNIVIGRHSTAAVTSVTTGSNNILIGSGLLAQSATSNGQLSIANALFGSSNTATGTTLSTGTLGAFVTSPTASFDIAASTTAKASLRIRKGVAPTSPNDGDIWYDDAAETLHVRIDGVTRTFTVT